MTSGDASAAAPDRLVVLPPGAPPRAPRPVLSGGRHPSRQHLERLIGGDRSATDDLRAEYAAQAAQWRSWSSAQRDYLVPLRDGLDRGLSGVQASVALEVGCGTGEATALVHSVARRVIALDLVHAMARQVPPSAGVSVLVADVCRLPVRSGSIDLIVGLNAVPDLGEFRRVLAPGGHVLWANSFGEDSPLFLEPQRLADAWNGETAWTARAGHGHWTSLTTAVTAPG